ncbi:MAG: hydrogenase maturation protease [Gemmatimonadota bacterium]
MSGRTLVAGIGNVFFSDDGFGVEVAARLAQEPLRNGVRVVDTGIRARHLAFELLDGGYDTAILVDAVARGGAPGTVYLIEPEPDGDFGHDVAALDGHTMGPGAVLGFLRQFGGAPTRVLVVGCEPERVDEGMGLSPPVAAAVEDALTLVRSLLCA